MASKFQKAVAQRAAGNWPGDQRGAARAQLETGGCAFVPGDGPTTVCEAGSPAEVIPAHLEKGRGVAREHELRGTLGRLRASTNVV